MYRNSEFPGHQEALSLADRKTYLRVSDCKYCGHAIAWATSKKTGKRYPVNVQPKQTVDFDGYQGTNSDVLRAAPWSVHTRETCERNKREAKEARERMEPEAPAARVFTEAERQELEEALERTFREVMDLGPNASISRNEGTRGKYRQLMARRTVLEEALKGSEAALKALQS